MPSVAEAIERMTAAGCRILSTAPSPFGPTWTTVVDRTGVTLELIEDPALTGPSQMRHMRITARVLDRSVPWYENLGFTVVDQVEVTTADFLGSGDAARGCAVRLRLPDEPFEVILVEWAEPTAHGAHYDRPNHAGLFRCVLHVYDTRASMEAMQAAGTEFIRGPVHTVLNVAAQLDMWLCFLLDPDGILYEFVGRPADTLAKA